jgi:6-phosphogluconate dehydrogenase
MEIGMVGLGKMGSNMALRLLQAGHQVAAYDLNESSIREAEKSGATGVRKLEDLPKNLSPQRAVWVMVPSGIPTEETIQTLSEILSTGDIIIDGGNSNYKDSIRRGEQLKANGIHFIDVGTSGGVWGLSEGYSMMVGGEETAVEYIRPVLESLAPAEDLGWGHVGPIGSGHFVKMIHNGIEYGLMQAYAEGFEILRAKTEFGDQEHPLDLHQIAEIWRYGSVIRSWLLDLTAKALSEDNALSEIEGWVDDSGEGRWTVFEAVDLDVPAPVITQALQARFVSRQDESYAAKILAAMRQQFGGHAIKRKES